VLAAISAETRDRVMPKKTMFRFRVRVECEFSGEQEVVIIARAGDTECEARRRMFNEVRRRQCWIKRVSRISNQRKS
jgi:hypothetical protein